MSDEGVTRLGKGDQYRLLFEAAVRNARKELRARQKESPHALPPPLMGASASDHGMCVVQFTFRQPGDEL